jgi:predicted Zn-dependent protease
MEGTERRVELFRLINGLDPSDQVVASRSVKLVTD